MSDFVMQDCTGECYDIAEEIRCDNRFSRMSLTKESLALVHTMCGFSKFMECNKYLAIQCWGKAIESSSGEPQKKVLHNIPTISIGDCHLTQNLSTGSPIHGVNTFDCQQQAHRSVRGDVQPKLELFSECPEPLPFGNFDSFESANNGNSNFIAAVPAVNESSASILNSKDVSSDNYLGIKIKCETVHPVNITAATASRESCGNVSAIVKPETTSSDPWKGSITGNTTNSGGDPVNISVGTTSRESCGNVSIGVKREPTSHDPRKVSITDNFTNAPGDPVNISTATSSRESCGNESIGVKRKLTSPTRAPVKKEKLDDAYNVHKTNSMELFVRTIKREPEDEILHEEYDSLIV